MKSNPILLLYSLLFCNVALAQDRKIYDWGITIAINSIHAQVEVPLITSTSDLSNGTGAVIVDSDGNIIAKGDRIDNSYSLSITPKYRLANDFCLRFEFGITNLRLTGESDSKGNFDRIITNKEVTTNLNRYAPGLQWLFLNEKKIEAYFGLSINFVDYKAVTVRVNQEIRQGALDTMTSWVSLSETTPGGFSTGFGAIAGFNIYFIKQLSIGAEVSSTAMYYNLGGNAELMGNSWSYGPPSLLVPVNFTYRNSYKGAKISKLVSSFNI